MKIALISLMIMTSFFLVNFSAHLAVSQQENFLVGYWPFDEGKGNAVADKSGKGNHGKINGNFKWVDGVNKSGKALEFEPGACVDVPDAEAIKNVKEVTVAMWVKMKGFHVDWNHLLERDGSYGITINSGSKSFRYSPNSAQVWIETNFKVSMDTLYHLAMVWDNKGVGMFYVDAKKAHESKGVLAVANVILNIAHCGSYLVNGMIDEVKIWNKALTADEVKIAMESATAVSSKDKLAVTWARIKRIKEKW